MKLWESILYLKRGGIPVIMVRFQVPAQAVPGSGTLPQAVRKGIDNCTALVDARVYALYLDPIPLIHQLPCSKHFAFGPLISLITGLTLCCHNL
jgi:hypothetical protein